MVFEAMAKAKVGNKEDRKKSVEEQSYIRNERLRVKHQDHGRGNSSVPNCELEGHSIIGLSLRNVILFVVEGFSLFNNIAWI